MTNGSATPFSGYCAKQTGLQRSPKWAIPAAAIFFAAFFVVYIFFSSYRHSIKPPDQVIISACPSLAPGVHRITSDFGIRFDAPDEAFTIHAALRDMPPGTLYIVKLRDTEAKMAVCWRVDCAIKDLQTAYPIFSEHVEARNIRDAKGLTFGTDRWGYLQSGERWRYVTFSNGGAAGYEPTPPEQARLLDQVVNSACVSRDSVPEKSILRSNF